jgi:hypothetical protein
VCTCSWILQFRHLSRTTYRSLERWKLEKKKGDQILIPKIKIILKPFIPPWIQWQDL